ncbi:MAG: AAA family ATPase [Candidatus Woykebacteria bacterium]
MSTGEFKNIVVCGDVGTGTTTLSEGLAKKLGWGHVSAGQIFREYHRKHNIPLWNKSGIPDDLDKKVDQESYEKMRVEKNIVFDSHYGGWFGRDLPGVFRILLVCDKDTATKRILERQHTHKETPEEIEERRKQLRDKFKKLYSSDNYENPKYFHLVMDTRNTSEQEALEKAYRKFLSSG